MRKSSQEYTPLDDTNQLHDEVESDSDGERTSNGHSSFSDPNSKQRKDFGSKILPRASLKQKIEVLDFLKNNGKPRSQAQALRHFHDQQQFAMSQATLSNWVLHEVQIRKNFNENPHLSNYKRKPVLKYPEVTKAIESLMEDAYYKNIPFTDSMIKDKFSESLKEHGYDYENIKLSSGMLHSLKKRNAFTRGKIEKPVKKVNNSQHVDLLNREMESLQDVDIEQQNHSTTSGSSKNSPVFDGTNISAAQSRVSVSLTAPNSDASSPVDSVILPISSQVPPQLIDAHKQAQINRYNAMNSQDYDSSLGALQQHQLRNTNQLQRSSDQHSFLQPQDFNFDDIFNNPSIGFNTRLIHSDDQFSNMFTTPEVGFNGVSRPSSEFDGPLTAGLTPTSTKSGTSYQISRQQQQQQQPVHQLNDHTTEQLPYYPKFQDPTVFNSNEPGYANTNNTKYSNNRPSETLLTTNKRPYVLENFTYSRTTHPNAEKVEKILQNITNGYVTIYNSGTSAIMGILSYLNPMRICINNSGYQGTHQVIKLLNKLTGLKKLSLEEYGSLRKGDVILIETPMNPEGYCLDISYYAELAHSKGAFLIVDSTLAPPPLQFPFQFNADYILYSASKYFSGHSDLLAGFLVTKTKDEKLKLHLERLSLGTNIANFDSFLLLRSLRTFKMRILQQCSNTEKIINFLQLNIAKYSGIIKKIHHSSLQSSDFVFIQLNNYYNPVFAIEFNDIKIAETILTRFNFLSNNNNVEGGETIVELTSKNPNFLPSTSESNDDKNTTSNLLRFSIGCEDYEDIVRDLDQAMRSFKATN